MVDLIGRRKKEERKKERRKKKRKKEEQIWIAELKGSELVHLRCENKSLSYINFVCKFMVSQRNLIIVCNSMILEKTCYGRRRRKNKGEQRKEKKVR